MHSDPDWMLGKGVPVGHRAWFGNLRCDGLMTAPRCWVASASVHMTYPLPQPHLPRGGAQASAGVGSAGEGCGSSNWDLSHCPSAHHLQAPDLIQTQD